jgi:hypothetical protein
LTALELPESMPVGGTQSLSVKDLLGGGRVVDAMGPRERDISWSGYLYEQNQTERVRLLNNLRQSGQEVTLAWGVYSYQGVVADFNCETEAGPQKYRITFTVVSDNSAPQGTTLVSLASQVVADVSDGNVVGALSAVSQGVVAGPLASAASAVGVPGATTVGSSLYSAAVGAVNTAAAAISGATSLADGVLAPLGVSIGSISAAAPAALNALGFAGDVSAAANAAGDLANLTNAAGYVGRAVKNLAGASA